MQHKMTADHHNIKRLDWQFYESGSGGSSVIANSIGGPDGSASAYRGWHDAHESASHSIEQAAEALTASAVYGLSAIDFRGDNAGARRRMIVGLPIGWARGRWEIAKSRHKRILNAL
jgi:hypothetical protein